MQQVPVKRKDIKKLGDRLKTLDSLSDAERTLLIAVFAVAADVTSPENGLGYTTLVQTDGKNKLTVTVPDDYLSGGGKATAGGRSGRMDEAFTPGRIVADGLTDDVERKITDRVSKKITDELNMVKITSGQAKKVTGGISVHFDLEGSQSKPAEPESK